MRQVFVRRHSRVTPRPENPRKTSRPLYFLSNAVIDFLPPPNYVCLPLPACHLPVQCTTLHLDCTVTSLLIKPTLLDQLSTRNATESACQAGRCSEHFSLLCCMKECARLCHDHHMQASGPRLGGERKWEKGENDRRRQEAERGGEEPWPCIACIG